MNTTKLPPNQLDSLLPALKPVAKRIQLNKTTSREELEFMLIPSGLDVDWAIDELERWAKVLTGVRDDPSKSELAIDGLMLRDVPEASARLAVDIAASPTTAAPQLPPERVIRNPKDNAEMIRIPAGRFTMGTDPAEIDPMWKKFGWNKGWKQYIKNESPKHDVHLDDYYIYKHPVTVKQYRTFCDDPNTDEPRSVLLPVSR
jgi:formylglycine-generating enzyme required for sulfatase activity